MRQSCSVWLMCKYELTSKIVGWYFTRRNMPWKNFSSAPCCGLLFRLIARPRSRRRIYAQALHLLAGKPVICVFFKRRHTPIYRFTAAGFKSMKRPLTANRSLALPRVSWGGLDGGFGLTKAKLNQFLQRVTQSALPIKTGPYYLYRPS